MGQLPQRLPVDFSATTLSFSGAVTQFCYGTIVQDAAAEGLCWGIPYFPCDVRIVLTNCSERDGTISTKLELCLPLLSVRKIIRAVMLRTNPLLWFLLFTVPVRCSWEALVSTAKPPSCHLSSLLHSSLSVESFYVSVLFYFLPVLYLEKSSHTSTCCSNLRALCPNRAHYCF